jgi:GTP-binding protein EngB required for normal cell division
VNNHQLIGIDMPGYGFAFSSDEDRIRCGLLCSNFLRFRGSSLKRVFLLLDARHGFKLSDKIYFYHLLNCENPASAESISSPFDGTKLIPKGNIDIFKKNSDIHWKLQVILTKADLVERMDLARRIHLINDELTDILPGLCGGLPIVALSGKYKDGIVQVQRDLISLIPKNIIHSEQNE